MYRTAFQTSARTLRATGQKNLATASRRFASTAAAPSKGTWRGSALRWSLALGAVYWYNTSPLFADEPTVQTRIAPPHLTEADSQTVEAVIEEKRRKSNKPAPPMPPTEPKNTDSAVAVKPTADEETVQAAEILEEEAGQQGAYNPETGEINWDCPCLGGMAHGPCGEEFKDAFSCFIYSNEEPKGMDCIDKFQHMQDCFRQHPEIYAAELADDEETSEAGAELAAPTESAKDSVQPPAEAPKPAERTEALPSAATPAPENGTSQQLRRELDERDAPKRAYDATDANTSANQ